jgi:hypothetical protein
MWVPTEQMGVQRTQVLAQEEPNCQEGSFQRLLTYHSFASPLLLLRLLSGPMRRHSRSPLFIALMPAKSVILAPLFKSKGEPAAVVEGIRANQNHYSAC